MVVRFCFPLGWGAPGIWVGFSAALILIGAAWWLLAQGRAPLVLATYLLYDHLRRGARAADRHHQRLRPGGHRSRHDEVHLQHSDLPGGGRRRLHEDRHSRLPSWRAAARV